MLLLRCCGRACCCSAHTCVVEPRSMRALQKGVDHTRALPDHPGIRRLRVPHLHTKIRLEALLERPPLVVEAFGDDQRVHCRVSVEESKAEQLERARSLIGLHLLDDCPRRPEEILPLDAGRQGQIAG